MIKLIIFDAGDLLWKVDAKVLEKQMNDFFEKYGIDGNIINSRWNRILPKVMSGKMKYKQAVDIEFRDMDISKKGIKEWIDIHTKFIIDKYILNPHVRPTLRKLRKNYEIVILSDEVRGKEHKISICKKLNVDVFSNVFCSCDIGYVKPHKMAFFTVLNHFKVRPNEAVFVAHSKDELEGARKYNIRTIAIGWDKGASSDFYVKKFSDIPEVLESIR